MTFNSGLAKLLVKICQWIYTFDDTRRSEIADGNDNPQVTVIEDDKPVHTSFVAVLTYQDKIIVAFQGTITRFGLDGKFDLDSLLDWIQNVRAVPLPQALTGLPGLIHDGFFNQLDSVFPKVKSALNGQTSKPIFVTGHSQGGAEAALATKLLELNGFPVTATYTFAAPRPGNIGFANSIRSPVFRFEFGNDIVPHLPAVLPNVGPLRNLIPADKFGALVHAFIDLSENLRGFEYAGVGNLTYKGPDGTLRTDLKREDEHAIFNQRVRSLLTAGPNLVAHHQLLPHYMSIFS